MEVKSFGAFPVILVKLATPPLPPQQSWILNKMGEIICWAGEGGGRVGGRREEPKTDQKIVISSRVLCNNYLEAFSTQSQVLLASIVEGKEIYFLLTESLSSVLYS